MPRLSGVRPPLGHHPALPFSSAFERRWSRLEVRFNICSFVRQVNLSLLTASLRRPPRAPHTTRAAHTLAPRAERRSVCYRAGCAVAGAVAARLSR